jgi:hypothetical protein
MRHIEFLPSLNPRPFGVVPARMARIGTNLVLMRRAEKHGSALVEWNQVVNQLLGERVVIAPGARIPVGERVMPCDGLTIMVGWSGLDDGA